MKYLYISLIILSILFNKSYAFNNDTDTMDKLYDQEINRVIKNHPGAKLVDYNGIKVIRYPNMLIREYPGIPVCTKAMKRLLKTIDRYVVNILI